MSDEIRTPLTYEDALEMAVMMTSGRVDAYGVARVLMALDVASRSQAREDYHMYPPPHDFPCAACGNKPAQVQVVDSGRQTRHVFCSLACAQGYDFARGDAQRREWAQMEVGE